MGIAIANSNMYVAPSNIYIMFPCFISASHRAELETFSTPMYSYSHGRSRVLTHYLPRVD